MANRFFTYLANLVAYQRAKAGDVAANFTLLETGLGLVADEIDRTLHVQASDDVIGALPLKAVRKGRALTFDSNGDPVASTTATSDEMLAAIAAANTAAQKADEAAASAASLYGMLPGVAGQAGKVLRTDGAVWAAGDWWGAPITLTVANNGIALTKRTVYRLDPSGGSFSVLLPAGMTNEDWVEFEDPKGLLATNPVTVQSNGNGNFRDGDTFLLLDVSGDSPRVTKTATGVIDK